ncbi:hypothetical protein Ddye_026023 [Dipteronia dyeriana]|uniref:RNase H type-1 domain-containing protein n=1 Tax=Dipteronia dyeriana TaxID=168575 RepID=A0AAD9TM78_9ROSI|nr:hypothetical protein Ddye_026023 [Dipteronia dyeriana]
MDDDFMGWSLNFLECFCSVNSDVDQAPIAGRGMTVNWCKPDHEWFKVNTDVVVDSLKCCVGVGIIIINRLGVFRHSFVLNLRVNFSPQIAEVVALFYWIRLAVEENFVPVVVKSYAKAVVDMIKLGVVPTVDIDTITGDILHLICGKPISISFVPRLANSVAHGLAKLALSVANERVWINSYPP